MPNDASEADLQQIRVDFIDRNPENPRLVFRPGELEDLLESIRVHGVQVPVSVYKEGRRFVLIDGERRWRCSLKLNRAKIPALVQAKPDPLQNLLLMFNIHSLREQWDLLTIALKLGRVIELLTSKLGWQPTERELSEETGLNRSIIRRSRLLMELPDEYKDLILEELNKPKSQQKLTEDLFIEMERALKTVERAMPEVMPNKNAARRVLLRKFKDGVIESRIHFRHIGKIARAENVGYDRDDAAKQLQRLFTNNSYSIEQAFLNSVGEAYRERDVATRVSTLLSLLEQIDPKDLDADVKKKLEELRRCLVQLLGK
jgi:ParB family transcriptional regulator, chromosome partitioning protein